MLGKKSSQGGLFRPDNLHLKHVGEHSFYGFMAKAGRELFKDDDFADLYTHRGRPSVPPSQLCVALILQAREGLSDEEAVEHTAYDLRWKVALGLELEERLCAKSSLQLFRAKLILHKKYQRLFDQSVEKCRRSGLLPRRKLEAALDTTPIFGKGAVKDTFNLIADQIRRVVDKSVELKSWERSDVIEQHGLSAYFGKSFKGEVELDWHDKEQKRALVSKLVADARVALELAKQALHGYHKKSESASPLREAAALLADLLLQDIDEQPPDGGGPEVRQGTTRGRVVSTTDPEMRHGRKSSSKTFTGFKGSVVADTSSGVVLATDVMAANAHDSEGAAELVKEAATRADADVERILGDTAYGSTAVREQLKEVASEVISKSPPATNREGRYTVDDFNWDEDRDELTCPAGKVVRRSRRRNSNDSRRRFVFPVGDCGDCPLKQACTGAASRTVFITDVTRQQQEHRRRQREPEFQATYRRRVVVEHRIARLVQLGIRKARYFGRWKVRFQLAMAATVANLSLVSS